MNEKKKKNIADPLTEPKRPAEVLNAEEESESKKKREKRKKEKQPEIIKEPFAEAQGGADDKVKQLKSVKVRMLQSYILVIALSLIASVVALVMLFVTGSQIKSFYNGNYLVTNKAWDAKYAQINARNELLTAMLEDDFKVVKQKKLNAIDGLKSIGDMVEELRQYDTVDGKIIDTIQERIDGALSYVDEMAEAVTFGQSQKAYKIMKENYVPAVDDVADLLEQVAQNEKNNAASKVKTASTIMILASLVVIVIAAISITIAMLLAVKMAREICNPVKEIENAAKLLAEGELDINIDYYATDEMGILADNMRASCEFLKNIIEDSNYLLGSMSSGDFTVTSRQKDKYVGEFKGLLKAMQDLKHQMKDTLSEIDRASDQVASSSNQIADNSQALAEGATDQAGAIQELTAMVAGVSDASRETSEIASASYKLAMNSIEQAKAGMAKMSELLTAMDNISTSSQQIEVIITEIENIADQTSLLSLNASIEAARAGEAGRGFAVVADQIGKLAADSSQSVVNTRNMIQASLDQIEKGNIITEETSKEIEKIMEAINELAESMKLVDTKATMQTESIEQVERGIEQISEVTENNSAAAQESAATSEEFTAQAENLKALIEKFKL